MPLISVSAEPAVFDIGVEAHNKHGCCLGDSGFKGQVDRWGSRPLHTKDSEVVKFSSFKGRGYALLHIGESIFREPYRLFKNFFVVAELIVNFVRNFFQCLFREDGAQWRDLGLRAKNIASAISAILVRTLTFALDLLKLSAGILIPKAAIRYEGKNESSKSSSKSDEI